MNAKINEKGFLEIERQGVFKRAECPFDASSSPCGDWCSQFVEPQEKIGGQWFIDTCHVELECDQIEDCRGEYKIVLSKKLDSSR